MFLKSLVAKILAKRATKKIQKWASNPIEIQQKSKKRTSEIQYKPHRHAIGIQ